MTGYLFALEFYETSDRDNAVPELSPLAPGADACLVAAVHLPADGVVLAFVEGPDARTVAQAADAAGWRVDRLCQAAWIGYPGLRPEAERK